MLFRSAIPSISYAPFRYHVTKRTSADEGDNCNSDDNDEGGDDDGDDNDDSTAHIYSNEEMIKIVLMKVISIIEMVKLMMIAIKIVMMLLILKCDITYVRHYIAQHFS